jgi:molybdate transport system permease protein
MSGAAEVHDRSDTPFVVALSVLGGSYVLLILALLAADLIHLREPHLLIDALRTPEIRHAVKLSLVTCSVSTLLCLWVAVPLAYLMSRYRFPLKACLDAVIDIPIVLPPLVIGLSLLMLFQTAPGRMLETASGLHLRRAGHHPRPIHRRLRLRGAHHAHDLR